MCMIILLYDFAWPCLESMFHTCDHIEKHDSKEITCNNLNSTWYAYNIMCLVYLQH